MPVVAGLDPKYQPMLDRIEAIPAIGYFGLTVTHLEEGICHAVMPHNKDSDGIFNSYHGGLLATCADMVACLAIMTQLSPDQAMATTDLNIRYLRPCLTDVTAKAHVIRMGKTLCPAHVDLLDARGRLVAVAQAAYMLIPGPTKS